MTSATVSVVDADRAPGPSDDWVIFRWQAQIPPVERLTEFAAAADTAALVALTPTRRRHRGPRTVDLAREPGGARLDGAVLLFRGRLLREHDLRPDPDLDPDLAALLLAARYLLAAPRPTVAAAGLRGSAVRPAGADNPARYTLAPRRFAELFEQVRTHRGSVPRWLQQLWVRQLFDYLREDARLTGTTAALDAEAVVAFHTALRATMAHIDDEAIVGYPGADGTVEARAALLLGARGRHANTRPVRRHDPDRGLTRFSYYFAGAPPRETIRVDGARIDPEHHKIRTVEVVGTALLAERILWVPAAAEVAVDGAGEVELGRPIVPGGLARYRRIVGENPALARTVVRDLRLRRRARGAAARLRYRGAWLLMDRDSAAQDNAEHLYRHLMHAEPDVNAWFVLARRSPDWHRLEREGFRLIDFGTDEHVIALLNCAHLVSSQVDDYVVLPFRRRALGPQRWRFTFLQHGVLWHDLSRWLNRKQIDLFVTSTPTEHEAIVADRSRYAFTDLEVQMVGLARHDRLLRLAQRGEPCRILVMPTWRPQLLGDKASGNDRELLPGFWESDYARAWSGLLADESLRVLCEQRGWQLVFVPHPNMQACIDDARLPEHVSALRFGDVDVQALIAGAAVLVTDYSSLANDAAYAGRPVVYYQFDRADFFAAGADFRRLGAWSYERDGFGPVCTTGAEAVAALGRIAAIGGAEPDYAARIERGFPLRDGQCCRRTVDAIRAICGP